MKQFYYFLLANLLYYGFSANAQPVLPPGVQARFFTTFENPNPFDSVIRTYIPATAVSLWDTVGSYRFPINSSGKAVRGRINPNSTSILELKPFSTLGHFKVWLDFAHIAKLEFNDTAIIQYSVDAGLTWTRLLGTACRYLGASTDFRTSNRFTQFSYPADWSPSSQGATPLASWWKQERFDMSPLVSNRADVRIRFLLKDGNNNGLGTVPSAYGWLVDSILVTSAFSEGIAPLITHTALTGVQFNINQSFTAVVRDSLGCDSTGIDTAGVHLFYRINSGNLDSVRMLRQGTTLNWVGNLDSTRIADGDTVRYLIRAIDSSPRRNIRYFPNQAALGDSFITYIASRNPTVVHSAPVVGYQFSPGPFVINAQMSDASGIDSAILAYSLNNGPLQIRRMPNVGGINFRDTIFTVDGDSVRYYIEAVDNSPRRYRRKLPDTAAFYSFTASGPPLVEWPATFQQCDVFLGAVYNLGPFTIPVKITDGSEVDTAFLHYKVNNGAFQSVGMTRAPLVRDTLARWNFNGASAATIPGGTLPIPHRGSGTSSLVNAPTGSFVLGNAATSSNNSSDSAAGATNFTWSTNNYPAINNNTLRGYQFSVSTAGRKNILLSFDMYHAQTASRFVRLEYSTNGGTTWTSYTGPGTDTANLYRANLGGNRWYHNRTANFAGISGVDNNAAFKVRLVAVFSPGGTGYVAATTGQTYATTGTIRMDAVTFSGEIDGYCNWLAQVPAVSDSDTVAYYVRALDRSVRNNQAINPAVSNPRVFVALNELNLPYQDGFEVSSDLWSPYILSGPVNNPVYTPGGWVRGTPAKSIINAAFAGTKAWTVDSLNGNYPNNAFYVLESPVFNFQSAEQSYLNFMQWRAIDSGGVTNPASTGAGDAFWVEYTRNIAVPNWQKLGIYSALPNSAQSNWYNRPSISGLTTTGAWDGRTGGWRSSEIRLPDSLFKGTTLGGPASKVRFRLVFRSNATTVSNGVAVDNIKVGMVAPDLGIQCIAADSLGTPVSFNNNNYQVLGGEGFRIFICLKNYGLRNIVDTLIPITLRVGFFTQTTFVRLSDTLRSGEMSVNEVPMNNTTIAPFGWFNLNVISNLNNDDNSSNDSASVIMFGEPRVFCLPNLFTNPALSVGIDSVVIRGDILNDGGSSIVLRGVCYSTTPNPNMGNPRTEEGSGIGSFASTLRNLSPSTTYYARSYAKNSQGVVVYGNEVSFSTGTPIPGVRCPGTPSVTDIDGNLYHTVQIGTQCWTQSNLKVSKYRNGDSIPTGLSNSGWGSTTIGAYAIYDNNSVNDGLYGKLYNHYSVMDSRGLCPTGWHVPTDGEWTTLETFLGGSSVAGGALKSTVTQPTPGGWNLPNTGATNSSGFSAGPGGLRIGFGDFHNVGYDGCWWSSSLSGPNAWFRNLKYDYGLVNRYNYPRTNGFSVRCLRD